METGKKKTKPKNEKGPTIFSPQQIQCIEGLFGSKRAEALKKEKPSPEEMKKMAPCMGAGKTKPKAMNEKGPTVFGPQQMQCLIEVFGSKKAESLRLAGLANASKEEIQKMKPCMKP